MATDAVAIARRRDVWRLAAIEMLIAPLDEPFLAFVIARAAASGGRAAVTAQALAISAMVGGVGGSLAVARSGVSRAVLHVGYGAMVVGTLAVVAVPSLPGTAAGVTAVGVGMAIIWSDLHVRTLRTVPGRSATVSIVVGTLGSAAATVPILVGVLADGIGLTAGLAVYVGVAVLLAVVGRPGRAEAPAFPDLADDSR